MTRVILSADWALFCRVIDNHGDLGVCWRLATQLAERGLTVVLYTDDDSSLRWMAPMGCAGVNVQPWPAVDDVFVSSQVAGVVIEAFGCELPACYQAAMASCPVAPVWINLEYFSLEASAQRNHGLPSPVLSGPAQGLTKWFYYPGWGQHSGGLLTDFRRQISGHLDLDDAVTSDAPPLHISVFCYEPAGLVLWLKQLSRLPRRVQLHVTAGRATRAVRSAISAVHLSTISVDFLDYLSQADYDNLLSRMDLNLVRGEDSLVRAMCAGKPFLWHIYPQHDGAHIPKLQAFLAQTQAPSSVVQAHLAWNASEPQELSDLTPDLLTEWADWARHLQTVLERETGLTQRLMGFVAAKG